MKNLDICSRVRNQRGFGGLRLSRVFLYVSIEGYVHDYAYVICLIESTRMIIQNDSLDGTPILAIMVILVGAY